MCTGTFQNNGCTTVARNLCSQSVKRGTLNIFDNIPRKPHLFLDDVFSRIRESDRFVLFLRHCFNSRAHVQ